MIVIGQTSKISFTDDLPLDQKTTFILKNAESTNALRLFARSTTHDRKDDPAPLTGWTSDSC